LLGTKPNGRSKHLPSILVHTTSNSINTTRPSSTMTTSTAPHSRLDSRPGRRPRRAGDVEDLGKKPKKVNSEARKQQNRIASRNYRMSYLGCIGNSICRVNVLFCAGEKRKQKLQYLQQLIRDGSNDEQTPEPSPRQHETHLRSLSAEYDTGASSSPYMLPASDDFTPMNSSSAAAHCQAPPSHHILPTTQSYSPFHQHWNSPIYDPLPPPNMSYMPNWVPNMNYSSRLDARPENFQFSPSLGIPAFDQSSSPYNHPRQLVPNADHYDLGRSYGHYNESQSHTPNISSVSLPTPSSYFAARYSGPH
jgi:hypothetical protein